MNALTLPRTDYGSRFINSSGRILWLSFAAEDKTAEFAAQLLFHEADDSNSDDEINAILYEFEIEPSAIAPYRADVLAVAARARFLAEHPEQCGERLRRVSAW